MCEHTPQSSLTNTHTYCVMCKSEIFAGAKLCPICKSYQSRCKRSIYNCATMGGIIMVAIALLTYVTSTWPEIRKMFFWRDVVEITAFKSKSNIVILNSGDGKVFVSNLLLYSKELEFSTSIPINKTIESKAFLVYDLNPATRDLATWDTGAFTEDFWQSILLKGRPMQAECIQWFFYYPDDPEYQLLKMALGSDLRSVSANATIYFHSGRDGHRISQNLKVFAVPYLKRARACGTPVRWLRLHKP